MSRQARRNTNVVNFPARTPEQAKMYVDDDIFFSKAKVREGTHFINVGMRGQGEPWIVEKIVSHRTTSIPGRLRSEVVDEVRYLSDRVTLRSNRDGKRTTTSFGTLRYSSTWRLA